MIQNILDMKAVTSAGPFLYVVLQDGTTNAQVSTNLVLKSTLTDANSSLSTFAGPTQSPTLRTFSLQPMFPVPLQGND